MTEAQTPPLTFVCLASYFKGAEFMRECRRAGCRVFVITKEKFAGEDWPRESLEELIVVPNETSPDVYLHTVNQLGRRIKIDRVVALEEFDVMMAGRIREELLLPGMSSAEARRYRDKLLMRAVAKGAGIRVPEFVHVLNYEALGEYMQRVPAPWVMKPRSDVSAVGIKKIHESEELWRAIDAFDEREKLLERSPYYLLERFVPGEVFHVDSLVNDGQVAFAGVNRYGRPPMDVSHQGGVFISQTVKYNSPEQRELLKLNRKLIRSFGLTHGATHAEFIKSDADGEFYFLEVACRVGGAYIAETMEAASGLNIWREWARIEIARGRDSYKLPAPRREYGGIALSLARQEYPDTSGYTDAEIVYRVRKANHVGLIVRSPDTERVNSLLCQYARRFIEEFTAVVPPPERPG